MVTFISTSSIALVNMKTENWCPCLSKYHVAMSEKYVLNIMYS